MSGGWAATVNGSAVLARAHLGTAAGARAVPGSQRVRMRRRGPNDSAGPVRAPPLRAEDGSRSVPAGRPGDLVVVTRCAVAQTCGLRACRQAAGLPLCRKTLILFYPA